MKIFSDRFKLLRGGGSQVSAARKLGISQQAWGKYENNSTSPTAESLCQICRAFKVSADWLLGLSENREGGATTITDPALVARNEELEAENARLKEENLRLAGEANGLRHAIGMLTGMQERK